MFISWLPWLSILLLMITSRWSSGLFTGFCAGSVYSVARGLSMGRLPLIGPHDTLIFFALSLAVMGLIMSLSPLVRGAKWFTASIGITAGLAMLSAQAFRPLNMPLPQILDTFWFELHVVVAFFGYALFVIGGLLCAAYLLTGARQYLDVYYKAALVGWSFFSASMVAGGIWGYYAWGTYWLWTAKELWTSVLWLYYAMALHARLKGVCRDSISAWIGIFGVFIMLFTYLGVSFLMKSSHSF